MTKPVNSTNEIYEPIVDESAAVKAAKQAEMVEAAALAAKVEAVKTAVPEPISAKAAATAGALTGAGQMVAGGMTGAGTSAFRPLDRRNLQKFMHGDAAKVELLSRAAFRGMPLACLSNVTGFAVLLGTQPEARAQTKKLLGGNHPLLVDASTGFLASTTQAVVIRPMNVIQTRSDLQHKTPRVVFVEIIHQGNPREFYKGLVAMITRNGVHTAIAVPAIDLFRSGIRKLELHDGKESTSMRLINGTFAGALAGMVGVLGSQPVHNYSVIRTAAGPKHLTLREGVQMLVDKGAYKGLGFSITRMGASYAMMGLATECVIATFPNLLSSPHAGKAAPANANGDFDAEEEYEVMRNVSAVVDGNGAYGSEPNAEQSEYTETSVVPYKSPSLGARLWGWVQASFSMAGAEVPPPNGDFTGHDDPLAFQNSLHAQAMSQHQMYMEPQAGNFSSPSAAGEFARSLTY